MLKYKLTIVNEAGKEETIIGTFKNEAELEKWARENKGELAKCREG